MSRLGFADRWGSGLGSAALVAACLCSADRDASSAAAGPSNGAVLRCIPAETRVVLETNPADASGQQAREAVGLDAVLGRLPSRRALRGVPRRVIVAFVRAGGTTGPLCFSVAERPLALEFERLRGEALGAYGGTTFYRAADDPDVAVALVDPSCLVEGAPQAVRAVLELMSAPASAPSSAAKRLADLPEESSGRRLLAGVPAASPVSLVYLAPANGCDLGAALRDLDRVLNAGLADMAKPYDSALQMLGKTHGLRIDMRQAGQDLATTLQLAMPNRVAAQLASVSLEAGKDMARVASDAAVRAGTLRASDARVMEEALQSLRARADGDLVHVDVVFHEPGSQWGAR